MQEVEQNLSNEVVPQTESNTEAVQQAQPNIVDDREERDWRAAKEKRKELERELKMQKEINERLIAMTAQAAPKVEEIDELDQLPETEFLDKGKNKKLVRKEIQPLERKIQELEQKLAQQQQVQHIDKLKRQYSDFDEVVSPETMALLEEREPELVESIVALKDPYKIGLQTYKYMKALNIASEVPKARRVKEVEQKLEKNAKTVQSPLANDKRPIAQAFKMTEADKNSLYAEMMGYASQASMAPPIQYN